MVLRLAFVASRLRPALLCVGGRAQTWTFRAPFVRFLPRVSSSGRSLAGVDAASLPPPRPQADGEVDATLFCQALGPAFVHMLSEEQVQLDPVEEAARQRNAAILGLMREALTWPGCAFCEQGDVYPEAKPG